MEITAWYRPSVNIVLHPSNNNNMLQFKYGICISRNTNELSPSIIASLQYLAINPHLSTITG